MDKMLKVDEKTHTKIKAQAKISNKSIREFLKEVSVSEIITKKEDNQLGIFYRSLDGERFMKTNKELNMLIYSYCVLNKCELEDFVDYIVGLHLEKAK